MTVVAPSDSLVSRDLAEIDMLEMLELVGVETDLSKPGTASRAGEGKTLAGGESEAVVSMT